MFFRWYHTRYLAYGQASYLEENQGRFALAVGCGEVSGMACARETARRDILQRALQFYVKVDVGIQ
jgi:hypothetical protein